MIDFGASVDMCTGINFNPLYGMLDPRYSPPEELVMPQSESSIPRVHFRKLAFATENSGTPSPDKIWRIWGRLGSFSVQKSHIFAKFRMSTSKTDEISPILPKVNPADPTKPGADTVGDREHLQRRLAVRFR